MTADDGNSKASRKHSWVRLWKDLPTDPKFRVIAKRAGRPLSEVVAVFVLMMTAADDDGCLDWHADDAAAALDLEPEHVEAIHAAMQGKVLDANSLTGWRKRQPKREDCSTERVREFRKRRETQCNADETQRNAPEKRREDTDSEVEESPPSPLGGQADVKRTPVSDWKQAFARPEDSTGVEFSHGRVRLVNGARAEWLEKFGGDAAALDLALIEVGPQVQVNNRVPVRAQVDRHLATIVRRRLEQDDRYARAVASRQPKAEAPRKRSVLDIIREKPASEVVQ